MLILIPMQHSNSYTVCPGLHWLQGANTANDFSHAPAAFSITTLRQLCGGGRGSEEFEPVPDFFFFYNGVTKRMPCVLIFIHTFLMNFFFFFFAINGQGRHKIQSSSSWLWEEMWMLCVLACVYYVSSICATSILLSYQFDHLASVVEPQLSSPGTVMRHSYLPPHPHLPETQIQIHLPLHHSTPLA